MITVRKLCLAVRTRQLEDKADWHLHVVVINTFLTYIARVLLLAAPRLSDSALGDKKTPGPRHSHVAYAQTGKFRVNSSNQEVLTRHRRPLISPRDSESKKKGLGHGRDSAPDQVPAATGPKSVGAPCRWTEAHSQLGASIADSM